MRTAPLLLLAALPLGCRSGGGDDGPAPRPNILLIYTDDHAPHAISAYGSVLNRTPNIDRLANEGVLFRNSFVGNSICAPARATVLTGLHSHENGVIDNGVLFDGEQRTFPKLLQEVGYQTAIVGKWHLKTDPTGFDYWEVLIGQGPYYNPPMDTAAGKVEHVGYTTEVITDRALDWLRDGRDPNRPFLLMYQHKAPHREWAPGPDYLDMYDDVTIPEAPTLFDDWSGRASGAAASEMSLANHMYDRDLKLVPPGNLTPEQLEAWNAAYGPKNAAFEAAGLEGEELLRWRYQRYLKDYLRCIASVDDQIGRVLDYLDQSGLSDSTVVVYSSDQGFYLGDHGWYDKRWMYEESFRTPLIVRWPRGAAPGSIDEHLVQNIDLAPTFLALAGVEVPDDMHGESLVPLLRGEDPNDWRESLYYQYYEFPGVHAVPRHYGVRTDRYKLIHYYQLDEWELFDLEADPHELSNRYGHPAYAERTDELRAELERLREQYAVDVE
jgi:arylsulfatase A-like enzyme